MDSRCEGVARYKLAALVFVVGLFVLAILMFAKWYEWSMVDFD